MPAPKLPGASPAESAEAVAVARISQLTRDAFGEPPSGEIWIGDDAAWTAAPETGILLATDAAVEGVHADLALLQPADLGWRAVTATVSDVAAMGGRPCHAVVAICAPAGRRVGAVAAGVAEAAAAWGCPVVGGDLSGAQELVIVVTATGALDPVPSMTGPVRRSGARPGDQLLVTGPLGGSAGGLRLLRAGRGTEPGWQPAAEAERVLVDRHRRPRARVAEGQMARALGAHAMIDVSDGLAIDVDRLATASGVGVVLTDVPVLPGATEDEALGGGEDFELVLAVDDSERLMAGFREAGLPPPLRIGACTDRPAERRLGDGTLSITGYVHPMG